MENTQVVHKLVIVDGNFSESGNFSGYTKSGEQRIHFHGRVMEKAGITPENLKDVKWPLYAFATYRTFNELDENDEPTDKTFTRLQGGTIFKTRQEFINAGIEDRVLELEMAAEVAKVAVASGLTDKQLKELASLSV